MAMQQPSAQQSVVDIIGTDRQKINEQPMELEKRVQGHPTSQHPVFPTRKQEVLGHQAVEDRLVCPLLEQEMRQQAQGIREHHEVRQHLEHLTAGNMPDE